MVLCKKIITVIMTIALIISSGIAVFADDSPTEGAAASAVLANTVGRYKARTIEVKYDAEGDDIQIQYSSDKGKTWKTSKSNIIKNLKDKGLYQFRVTAKTGAVKTSSKTSYRYIKKGKVKKLTSTKKKKVKITWKKDPNATGYQIQCYDGTKWKKITVGKKTSATIKKLKSGKTYKFRVRPLKRSSGKTYRGILSGIKTVKVK